MLIGAYIITTSTQQTTKENEMNASIYSTDGKMAYQLGAHRVIVEGKKQPRREVKQQDGTWKPCLNNHGAKALIAGVKANLK
jgi:hypothetical protein